jgi:glutamyl-tRNA reductase
VAGSVHYEPFSKLPALPPVDVLVTCLGRAAPAMAEDELPSIGTLAIDLGTPRNLEELSVPVVKLADLLEGCSSPVEDARRRDLEERLRAILAAQLALRRPDSPLGALREEVERIRQRELLRSLRLHPELPAEKLDAITRSLVNQIFHRPSLRLRDSEDVDLAEAVAALFQPASRDETHGRD